MKSFKIKSKNTEYNGYNFRSRLEARWAMFLDEMGIRYLYEPQTFILEDGTLYIPDFYLPKLNAFIEVKCEKLNFKDFKKAFMLAKEGPQRVFIFDRDPSPEKYTSLIQDKDNPKGYKIKSFNLILNDNKDNFKDDLFLVDREDYENHGYRKELGAIDKARKHRFGVYE